MQDSGSIIFLSIFSFSFSFSSFSLTTGKPMVVYPTRTHWRSPQLVCEFVDLNLCSVAQRAPEWGAWVAPWQNLNLSRWFPKDPGLIYPGRDDEWMNIIQVLDVAFVLQNVHVNALYWSMLVFAVCSCTYNLLPPRKLKHGAGLRW